MPSKFMYKILNLGLSTLLLLPQPLSILNYLDLEAQENGKTVEV